MGKFTDNIIISKVVVPVFNENAADVDGDGEVNIIDATWIRRHVAGMDMPFTIGKTTADIDGDGNITVMDAAQIHYYPANMKNPDHIGKTVS